MQRSKVGHSTVHGGYVNTLEKEQPHPIGVGGTEVQPGMWTLGEPLSRPTHSLYPYLMSTYYVLGT